MKHNDDSFPICSQHGKPTKRGTCRECNAAYMRHYLKRRRHRLPGSALWERARKRAHDRLVPFRLSKDAIFVPAKCPALGLPIITGASRSANSPSLDRIEPAVGYVPGNVRVISDRANRLKSDCSFADLQRRAEHGPLELRHEYRMLVTYVEREQLLQEVRAKASQEGRAGQEWAKIALLMDRVFRKPILK